MDYGTSKIEKYKTENGGDCTSLIDEERSYCPTGLEGRRIYRGITEMPSSLRAAESWSLSREVAEDFAGDHGFILEMTICLEDVLHFFGFDDDELEVIVAYDPDCDYALVVSSVDRGSQSEITISVAEST